MEQPRWEERQLVGEHQGIHTEGRILGKADRLVEHLGKAGQLEEHLEEQHSCQEGTGPVGSQGSLGKAREGILAGPQEEQRWVGPR